MFVEIEKKCKINKFQCISNSNWTSTLGRVRKRRNVNIQNEESKLYIIRACSFYIHYCRPQNMKLKIYHNRNPEWRSEGFVFPRRI